MTPIRGILVCHDRFGGRIAERLTCLAEETGWLVPSVPWPADNSAFGDLEEGLRERRPNEVFPVMHLVGDDPGATRESAFGAIDELLHADFPQLLTEHWLVLGVHRGIDAPEIDLIERCTAIRSDDVRIGGALIGASSSERSVAHDEDEEATGLADTVYCMFTTDLRSRLTEAPPTVWTAGASSAVYRKALVAEAMAAESSLTFFTDHLLAPARSDDPASDEGEAWVSQLDLAGDTEGSVLFRAAGGGTLDRTLDANQLPVWDIDLRFVPDLIGSFYDQLTFSALVEARAQINRNAQQRLRELVDRVAEQALSDLRRQPMIEHSVRFWQGAVHALDAIENTLLTQRATQRTEAPELGLLREELERLIRRFPYLPAVVVRFSVLAFVVAYLVQLLVPATYADSRTLIGAAAGLAVLLVGGLMWMRRRAQVHRAIRRYLAAITDQLRAEARDYLIEQRIELVRALKRAIAGQPADPGDSTSSDPGIEAGEGEGSADDRDDPINQPDPRTEPGLGSDNELVADRPGVTPVLATLEQLRVAAIDTASELARRSSARTSTKLHETRYAIALPSINAFSTSTLIATRPLPADLDIVQTLADHLFALRIAHTSAELEQLVTAALAPLFEPQLWGNLERLLEDSRRSRKDVVDVLSVQLAAGLTDNNSIESPHVARRAHMSTGVKAKLERTHDTGSMRAELLRAETIEGVFEVIVPTDDVNSAIAVHVVPLNLRPEASR